MIALYHGHGLMSRLIRWRTWSKVSHAAWLLADGSVIEAWTSGGVRHVASLSTRHHPGTTVRIYRVPGLHSETVEKLLTSQLGKKYDWLGILGFVFRRRTQNQDRFFCSELIYWACRMAGLELLREVEPWQVSPGELATSPFLEFVREEVTV
jgi:uncharacterized protein YycO